MHQFTEFKVCFAQLYRVAKATFCSGKLIRRRVYASALWWVGGKPYSVSPIEHTSLWFHCDLQKLPICGSPPTGYPQFTLFQCWAQILTESCHVQLDTRCNCYHLLAKTSSYFLACWRGAICTNQCWSGIIFWTYQSRIGCLLRISHQCIGYFLELP
jgi:hypothetical protein